MLVRVYDNGGKTFDRYTAVFDDRPALGVGPTGNVPNGFCMTVEAVEGSHLGELVRFDALPAKVQSAILAYSHEEA